MNLAWALVCVTCVICVTAIVSLRLWIAERATSAELEKAIQSLNDARTLLLSLEKRQTELEIRTFGLEERR